MLRHTRFRYESVLTDMTGEGITMKWDYNNRTCDISMPGYIERALQRFQHPIPTRREFSPRRHDVPQYGAKIQYTDDEDTSPALDDTDTKRVQGVLGTLLSYGRAIDSTILPAIGSIATQQSNPTRNTMQAITKLLNYCATNPNTVVRCQASDMVLHVESDASYLSVPKARSRTAGFFHMSNRQAKPNTSPPPNSPPPTHNSPISISCNIMKEVLSSAAEAESAGLFHNGKEACPMRIAVEEMGHPQPPTLIATDNSTAVDIANYDVKQKRSKAIDMRFYRIRDRFRQGQLIVYWRNGKTNKADYPSKHHATTHHRRMRPAFRKLTRVYGSIVTFT